MRWVLGTGTTGQWAMGSGHWACNSGGQYLEGRPS